MAGSVAQPLVSPAGVQAGFANPFPSCLPCEASTETGGPAHGCGGDGSGPYVVSASDAHLNGSVDALPCWSLCKVVILNGSALR